MNTLYPGLVGTRFIFLIGTFTSLILACAQISHGANFPVNSIIMYFAVGLRKCSPVCPVIWANFHMKIFFPGSITEWVYYPLNLNPHQPW